MPPFDYGYDCLKELVLIIEDLSAILSWQLLPLIHANVYVFQLSMESRQIHSVNCLQKSHCYLSYKYSNL